MTLSPQRGGVPVRTSPRLRFAIDPFRQSDRPLRGLVWYVKRNNPHSDADASSSIPTPSRGGTRGSAPPSPLPSPGGGQGVPTRPGCHRSGLGPSPPRFGPPSPSAPPGAPAVPPRSLSLASLARNASLAAPRYVFNHPMTTHAAAAAGATTGELFCGSGIQSLMYYCPTNPEPPALVGNHT